MRALIDAPYPKTVGEVQSLLGLTIYCSMFIPQLATIKDPLRQLCKKGTKWIWTHNEKESIDSLKAAVVKDALAYFDKSLDTHLITDASPIGLGAVLIQTNGIQSCSFRESIFS